MKVSDIVEENMDFITSRFGDSWEYDGVMEWYLKDGEKEVDVKSSAKGLIVLRGKTLGVRVRAGHSHPHRDYGTSPVEADDLDYLQGGYSNHYDFLTEEIINSLLVGDGILARILRKYVSGESCSEIATQMGKSVTLVSSYISRGRKRVNESLGTDIKTKREVRSPAKLSTLRKRGALGQFI